MKLSFVGKMRAKDEVTVLLLSGIMNGVPSFMYLGLSVADALQTLEAVEKGENIDLTGKAVVLTKGEGLEPPEDLKQEIYEAYGISELSEDEFKDALHPYLAEEE